jgi:hypothetical protein
MLVKTDGGFDFEMYDNVDAFDFDADFMIYYGKVSQLISTLAAVFNVNRDNIKFSASGATLRVEFDGFDCFWENVVYQDIADGDLLA